MAKSSGFCGYGPKPEASCKVFPPLILVKVTELESHSEKASRSSLSGLGLEEAVQRKESRRWILVSWFCFGRMHYFVPECSTVPIA